MEETTDQEQENELGASKPDEKDYEEALAKLSKTRTLIYTGFGGFLLFLLALAVFFYYNFRTIEVQGDSMVPTLQPGQRLLISKAYWLVGDIKYNDIVVINHVRENEVIIKRVYKLSGEIVDMQNVPPSWDLTQGEYTVPDNQIFVLGDNIEVSQDSRHYGPFDLNDVIGKVVVVNPGIGTSAKTGT